MSPAWLMAATLLAPAIGAAAVALLRRKPRHAEAASLLGASVLLVLVASMRPQVMDGERSMLEWFEFLQGIALSFQAARLGVLFARGIAFLWFITEMYAIG